MANSHSLKLLSASNQYAYCADNAALSITGNITISAWIKLLTLPSDLGHDPIIAAKYDDSASQNSYYLAIDHSGGDANRLLFAYFQDGRVNVTRGTCDAVFTADDVNRWYHVACAVTVASKAFTFYIDGVAQTDVVTTGGSGATAILNSTAPFSTGVLDTTGTIATANMLIDELRVWSDVRTAGEIQSEYAKETADTGNLAAYWKFNGNANDELGTSNLTLVNSPTYSEDIPFGSVMSGML